MSVRIITTEDCYDRMRGQLLPLNDVREHFGFALASVSSSPDSCNLLIREFVAADRSCLLDQSGASVRPNPSFAGYIWTVAKESNSSLINIHTHPFSDKNVTFSGIDDRSEQESSPMEVKYLGPGPHASIVLGRNSIDARWYNAKTQQVEPVTEVKILGKNATSIVPTSYQRRVPILDATGQPLSEIHDRQVLAFGPEGQKALAKQRVCIVGAGGIGSVVFELLIRLGVPEVIVIDSDTVEMSNLNRLAGSTLKDAREAVPKVEMLARNASQINPNAEVKPVKASILDEQTQELLKGCDAVFGCTDNQASRSVLNSFSAKNLIPYFDTGTGIQSNLQHKIEHAGGQVRVVIPGKGCLSCIDGIDLDIAGQEMLPEAERQIAIERGYIAGADVPTPAVASLNGVIAGLAVTEFMAFVTGFRPVHQYVYYDLMSARTWGLDYPSNPNCFNCSSAGLFGIGDDGKPLPEHFLNTVSKTSEGEIKMETQETTITQQINELVAAISDNVLDLEADAEGRWFLIRHAAVGPPFKGSETDVMVKFYNDRSDPMILVPDDLEIEENANVCPRFMEDCTYVKEWRCLCPHMFQDVSGELLQFILCLMAIMGNPSLCGAMGCEGKSDSDQGALSDHNLVTANSAQAEE